jgi:phosphoribosylcarboxyaminoimidazole (NCAIR) mutase
MNLHVDMEQTFQGEGLLPVTVKLPEGVGVGTNHIIESLKAALELAIRADEHWIATSPSPVAEKGA